MDKESQATEQKPPYFGEQDENGIDLSLLRRVLRLSPTERMERHQSAARMVLEIKRAGRAARLSQHRKNTQ